MIKPRTRTIVALFLLPFTLGGCQAIGNWFDSVGEHFPVIGDRCEHWQCFTESGREASDEKKAQIEKAKQSPAENPPPAVPPTPGAVPASPPNAVAPALPGYETQPISP